MAAAAAAATVAAMAGCANKPVAVDQDELPRFVARLLPPGLPMEQAMVRVDEEGFLCQPPVNGQIVCSRKQQRLFRTPCQDTLVILRTNSSAPVLQSAAISTACRPL